MRPSPRVPYQVLLWSWLVVATAATFASLAYALHHAKMLY
jgi:hypothetical protein